MNLKKNSIHAFHQENRLKTWSTMVPTSNEKEKIKNIYYLK